MKVVVLTVAFLLIGWGVVEIIRGWGIHSPPPPKSKLDRLFEDVAQRCAQLHADGCEQISISISVDATGYHGYVWCEEMSR